MTRKKICRILRAVFEEIRDEVYSGSNNLKICMHNTKLCGTCLIASWYMSMLFKKNGYDAKVIHGSYNGWTHCWVESNGRIYDITASQFDLQDVLIGSYSKYEKYKKKEIYSRVSQYEGWESNAVPTRKIYNYVMRKFKKHENK